jgi:hypothetical protein
MFMSVHFGRRTPNDAQAKKAEEPMTTRFPAPWRIVELPNGFAVEDATGKQIGVFFGRAPCSAGHTGIMTMDEARQMAIDFAKCRNCSRATGMNVHPTAGHDDASRPEMPGAKFGMCRSFGWNIVILTAASPFPR